MEKSDENSNIQIIREEQEKFIYHINFKYYF